MQSLISDGSKTTIITYQYDAAGNMTKSETSIDSDSDGLADQAEATEGTNPQDADTDDDGIADGQEKYVLLTDPKQTDTDRDSVQDGTELGITVPVPDPDASGPLLGTNIAIFRPDADHLTVTNPLNPDMDKDGLTDGQEDINQNGQVDAGERDRL